MFRTHSWVGAGLLAFAGASFAADCPQVTVADMKGVKAGKYPQQYELSEFESLANCKLKFSENPEIAKLNGKIVGNPAMPGLADRLPAEPLVVAPYVNRCALPVPPSLRRLVLRGADAERLDIACASRCIAGGQG